MCIQGNTHTEYSAYTEAGQDSLLTESRTFREKGTGGRDTLDDVSLKILEDLSTLEYQVFVWGHSDCFFHLLDHQ